MPLSNEQHNALMRMYEQKQLKSRDRLNRRYEEIYEKLPAVKEVDNMISFLSVNQARKLLAGDTAALEELKKEIHNLADKRSRLLAAAGYPQDYLEPVYECSDCHDTGYIGKNKCHCFLKAAIDLFYTQSNLQEILSQENFDTFSLDFYSCNYIDRLTGASSLDIAKRALTVCRDFVADFDSCFHNLLLYGSTGTGKTFLTHCIARELIETSHSVLYLTAASLLDIFQNRALDRDDLNESAYEHILDCDLLIIDDLGTERSTAFTVSQLFVCFNERILRKKSTIVSTNLSLDDIKSRYTERIFSRISSHYTMLRLVGDDIRIQKKLMNREAD